MSMHQQVKMIGSNGQVSLGKEFAGRMVLVDQIDESTWVIKSGKFIPDSEKWLLEGDNISKLEKALAWAKKNKPKDNLDELAENIERDKS